MNGGLIKIGTFRSERITSQKEKLGLKQSRIAEELGVNRATVSKWEGGKQFPPCELIPDLCKILQCDAGYLFGDFDTPHKETRDIETMTGLSFTASDLLLWFGNRDDEGTKKRKTFIEDLLSSPKLYELAVAYAEYQEILSCCQLASLDVEHDDFIYLPSGRTFLAVEADREKDIALFRLTQKIVAFAEGANAKKEK